MDEVINLNVGGSLYTTSLSTLTRYPESMLGTMFSGRIQSARDAQGNYVIDGDGPLFRYVLNFLRRSVLRLPDDFKELELFAAEADFYQIEELVESVRCLREERVKQEEEEKNRIIEMEYIELVCDSQSFEWTIDATTDILKKVPCIANRRHEDGYYGGKQVCGHFHTRRVELFRQTSQLGYKLVCMSSSVRYQGVTDRYVIGREIAP